MVRVFTCKNCSRVHLEIGNTQIHFRSSRHLEKYLDNLDSIDTAYYEAVNRRKGLAKVIILPLDVSGTVHVGFTAPEFEEFKTTIRDYLSNEGKSSTRYDDSSELRIVHWKDH